MGRGTGVSVVSASAPAPTVEPAVLSGGGGVDRGDYWRSFDNSVSAVSFGFVATAILISMFLIMAIFERFLRPRSPDAAGGGGGGGSPAGDDCLSKRSIGTNAWRNDSNFSCTSRASSTVSSRSEEGRKYIVVL
ncbi:hypothetical protein DH2020_022906 [Rehmannia glutinosa]|uniref:Uncharacterized protein n=1 Tax=Rehmannia glutinosa TaxID=99300 RepID=A0ABR0W4H5_REHGL